MEYLKRFFLWLLIAGIIGSVIGTPTGAPDEYASYDDNIAKDDGDYNNDDNYLYEDEIKLNGSEKHIDELVYRDPPFFEKDHLHITAIEGGDVTLPCDPKNIDDINLQKSTYIFLWFNGTRPLTQQKIVLAERDRVKVFPNYSVRIFNLQATDSGLYRCAILPSNVFLNITLTVKNITIYSNGEPVIDNQITVREGEHVEFECISGKNEKPTIKWSRKGERIVDGTDGIRMKDGKITIENVEHHHHGDYQCIADSGEESPPHVWLTLDVKYHPKITIKRHYVNAAIGDRAEMYCNYHANPNNVTSFWAKQGSVLRGYKGKYEVETNENNEMYSADHTVLFVNDVDDIDFGEYECVVKNNIGEGSGRIHLIQEPEPAHFENQTINGRHATIVWLVRSKQMISEAILDYRMNESDIWSSEPIAKPKHKPTNFWRIEHKVTLTPGTWHVRVKTKNNAGWSKFSQDHSLVIDRKISEEAKNRSSDKLQVASIGGGNGAVRTAVFGSIWSTIGLFAFVLYSVPSFRLS